ncbi:ABC transporter permease [Clostridium formicaceticum]|uniref:Dipeptide transport system permease protein DppC n=1 Tax=Clostridium formicaceticum TaxID=1497 RepID=A0AAC9RKE2_9CLOT|nr:ABC transporter permease [Clostridium formicaceticum]AOY76223.1 peptide ABC transporter permease [Clostridium formicaceticum]ARE86603.1 Dipeptide transport system permease protein DppC [Clostridium formicaceticum]
MKKIVKKIKCFSFIGKVSVGIIVFFIALAILGSLLSPHPYNIPSGGPLEPPSKTHWMGTDDLGIDLWAQICFGARISLIVGFSTAFLAVGAGGLLGVLAGYYGGKVDGWIMGITDLMIVIPELPMMIVLGAFFGPSLRNIILVLSVFSWTTPARIVRSKILTIKEEKYIKIAEGYGAGFFYITIKHFLPQILSLMTVSFIKLVSRAIVAEAGLAFLGLGDPTSKSWGLMLNHAMAFRGIYFTDFWKWWVLFPLICTMTVVLAVSFIGKEIERKRVDDYGKETTAG